MVIAIKYNVLHQIRYYFFKNICKNVVFIFFNLLKEFKVKKVKDWCLFDFELGNIYVRSLLHLYMVRSMQKK